MGELAFDGRESLFKRCLLASAAFHVALLIFGNTRGFELPLPQPDRVIDLTLPLGDKDNAPPGKLGRVGLPTPPVAVPPPPLAPPPVLPLQPAAPAVAPPPAVVPSSDPRPAPPDTAPEAAARPEVPAVSAPLGNPSGSAAGDPTATGGGGSGGPGTRSVRLDILPKLLNPDEVYANMRKFYPEAERLAGRQARVVVRLRLGVTGKVETVDVLQSAGAAFDAAAKSVAERMKFSPAMAGGTAVSVALPQGIAFKLE